jgi:hypothetical protein
MYLNFWDFFLSNIIWQFWIFEQEPLSTIYGFILITPVVKIQDVEARDLELL